MKNRSPLKVVLLSIITFGIYGIYWFVSTKNEMNARGEKIPTAWLIIIPFVNFYWYWEYSKGVEHVTNAQMSGAETFLLLVLIGIVGVPLTQSAFNKVDASAAVPASSVPATPGNVPQASETTMIPAQPSQDDTSPITSVTPPSSSEGPVSPDLSAPEPPAPQDTVQPQDSVGDTPADPLDGPKMPPANPPLVQ